MRAPIDIRMDRQTDGRNHVLYLPASRRVETDKRTDGQTLPSALSLSFAVDKDKRRSNLFYSLRHIGLTIFERTD